jgi:hypothetical protein
MIYVILGILALLFLFFRSSYEHMTSNDLRGPTIPKEEKKNEKEEPLPENQGGKNASSYPKIYGPELLLKPGHNPSSSTTYDFIPAPEFPIGPEVPSPFLTDFSKIMK